MASPPPASSSSHAPLTPQFCFTTTALKGTLPRIPGTFHRKLTLADFLRRSRSAIDDTISQHLNSLSTPSQQPFTAPPPTPSYGTRRTLPPERCSAFADNVLFPSWQSRSDVLNYCASVATSDDPDDPDTLAKMSEDRSLRERVVDERLDPYSGRFFPRETRTEMLAGVVRNERMVEEIVRDRTWRVVGERCGSLDGDWKAALENWRQDGERR